MPDLEVNGRTYVTHADPVVVVCVDGSEPAYHEAAIAAGLMPWLQRTIETGSSWPAHCAMPALTNPNNLSIATGVPPSVHGISGNWFLDPDTGREVMMNDPSYLRAPTLFAAAELAGLDVAVVTAKDKLRRLLGAGLRRGTCVSAETADAELEELAGRPRPSVYSAELSEFVLALGVRVVESRAPALTYLSTSDFVQHKHAPGAEAANAFCAMLDSYFSRLAELGAVVVVTADHGMSAKTGVRYLADDLRELCGTAADVHVVLPITDPYTRHHGALGSFASLVLPPGAHADDLVERLRALPGIAQVMTGPEAAARFALPPDRIGDVVVLAEAGTALGSTPGAHDLAGLDAPLRSHGALGELAVPFVVNRPLPRPDPLEPDFGIPAVVHNYDAFWVATTLVGRAEGPR